MSDVVETPYRQARLEEVKRLMDEGYHVIDVRDDSEWNSGHIPGAEHVWINEIIANPQQHQFPDRTIFVCEVGSRSTVASEMAVALGTRDVVNFVGGTTAWRKAGLPLEKPEQAQK
jgi:hydroxyacylglutathione hydrolase